MKLYGIRNCDTVKKARKWLDEAGIEYQFHDFKKEGLAPATLENWENAVGWEPLVNRRGTTWRKLPESVRDSIDARSAHELMLENTSLIKRPVLMIDREIQSESGAGILVGFNADQWSEIFTNTHPSGAHQ